MKQFTLHKSERLNSKTVIDRLFAEGTAFVVYPLKFVWVNNPTGDIPAQAAFSVSKKGFKKAVIRNRIKRRMRESYRLIKPLFYEKLKCFLGVNPAFMVIYIGKETEPSSRIKAAMEKGLDKLIVVLNNLSSI